LGFKEATDDWVAVASAGPYANHSHLAPERQPCQHLIIQFFAGWMVFMMLKQPCKSTEVKRIYSAK